MSRKKYKRRRRIVWAIVIAAGVVLLAGAWVGFRLWQAYTNLEAAAQTVPTISSALKSGDTEAAKKDLATLQQHSTAAQSASHDFLWSAGELVPGIGPNLTAVRTITESIDTLSWQSLPPLVELAGKIQLPQDGAMDVAPLIDAGPALDKAIIAIDSLHGTIKSIDTASLMPPVARGVALLDEKLDKVSSLAATTQKAVQLLPPMLGADGKRTYLVVFQNLAELRATGGIYGAYAVITADHGRIELVKQGATSGDIKKFDPPIVSLPPEEKALFTERPAEWAMDVNMSPDFPTGARLIRAMYQETFGTQVDGVIAADPVALAELLRGTGPVTLPSGDQLTSDNVVSYLLKSAYAKADNPAEINKVSDEIFAHAAKAAFTALVSGQGSVDGVLSGLQSAAAQHRLLIWSNTADEQKILATTSLGGVLPSNDGARPLVGVFLNDGTGGKMDYYLRQDSSLQTRVCRADGRAELQLRVTLSSKAPASGLPEYVTGLALGGDHVTRTNVMFYAPTGGSIVSATSDGEQLFLADGAEKGRKIGIVTVDLKSGESKTMDITLLTGLLPPEGLQGLELRTTPMSTPAKTSVNDVLACPAAK